MNGILPLKKPSGPSSYDMIRRLQSKIPALKKSKMGHAGTLDPVAEGVLLLLIGEATKLFPFLLEHDKVYEVWIQLGIATDTDDSTGNVIATSDKIPSQRDIASVVACFQGKIQQVPPRYSALKINGKRAYDLARKGEYVELLPRQVDIFEHVLLEYDEKTKIMHTRVHCSSGTYIRSLARDIGEMLGCYGHVVRLVRTETFGIKLEGCISVEDITEDNWTSFLVPMRRLLVFPVLEIKNPLWVAQGRKLEESSFVSPPAKNGIYQVVFSETLLAIGEWREGRFFYRRVFHG
ncbi:MAG: tRNA pseudouridine(55) synthase TruB [Brevinematales bacterium]